jgi:hypothetical protein
MSLWQEFLDNIAKPVGRNIVSGAEYAGQKLGEMIASPAKAVGDIVIPAAVNIGTTKPLAELNLSEKARQKVKEDLQFAAKEQAMSNDIVLKLGVAAHDNVISPYITRPIGTVALVTDPESPLYQADKFEKGFQVNDLRRAYNRTEQISLGQALTKSDITPIKTLASVILPMGGIDIEEVDLWNDQDVENAFVDNTVGRWFTGFTDFTVANVAISAVGGAATRGSKFAARKTGFSTRGRTTEAMERDIDESILFAQGAGGKRSNIGDDILLMAQTRSDAEIADILQKYSNNENLVSPIAQATNPETVRDLLLADKGYLPALDRLSKNAPADLFEMADVKSQIAAQMTKSTTPVEYTPEAWARMNAAFDDAINRVPEYRFIRDSLIDPENKTPWMFGRDYAPMEPVVGAQTFRTIRGKIQAIKTGRQVKDIDSIGGIESVIVGSPKVATRIIRFVGSEKPMGYVTFSGSRPFDSIRELNAMFDDLNLLRDPANLVRVSSDPDVPPITAGEFRAKAVSDVLSAKNVIDRKAALEKIDTEIGFVMAYTNGFFGRAEIEEAVRHIRNTVNNITVGLGQKGYAMDHTGMRIVTDGALTQRQLVESYRFSPWSEIEQQMKLKAGKTKESFLRTNEEIKALYETFNKWWTFEVLARPSYIPKQSLAEPVLSATMAHGAKFVFDNAPSMTKRFFENNKNRVMQVASRMYRGKELKAVDEAVTTITKSLDQANGMLDDLVALEQQFMDGSISPVAKAENYERVKKDVRAAERLVEDLELQLMDATKPFGQMADVPTISNLERRLDYIEKNIIGKVVRDTPSELDKYREIFPNLQDYLDGGSGGLPGTRSTVGFVKTSALRDMPGNVPGNRKAIESYRESLRSGKGFAIEEFRGEPYNDPIMVVYDNETGLAYVGEGNHRLQAAIAEGVEYVPVRVVRGRKSEMVEDVERGRFPQQIKNNKKPRFVETSGSLAGKPVGEGYVPPEMHPSYVFDKDLVLRDKPSAEASSRARLGAQIANAKSAIANVRGTIHTLIPNSKELLEANKKVAEQYQIIDNIIKDLGEAQYERAALWNRSAKYKERYYGTDGGSRMINGQWVRIEDLFDENNFGAAFREEFANSRTASQTYLGDLHEGIRQGLIMRRSPQTVTRSNNPMYFEELAYLVNRSFRGDPLVDQVLEGKTFDEILEWGLSDVGQSYFAQYGTVTKSQIPAMVRDQVAMVYRYLPNQEARSLALKGDVKSTELQIALARDIEKLHPIQPLDFNYVGLPEPIQRRSSFAYFDELLSKGAASVFRTLTRPENPIRWASANMFFFDSIARKANELGRQGLDVVGLDTINTLRSAARREALQENEKTFYTINRQNRVLYAARVASAFPAASLNAFYRYGRFAINNPQRVVSFLYNYQAAFRSFGVDQYGNQVDDPLKATHLIVPGTKEMGFFADQGIRLNARSIGFLLNFPTPSFYVAQATGQVLSWKPELEDSLKEVMGATYDVAFPYGPAQSFAKGLVPVWANDLYKYAVGPESDKDFLDSWNSVHNYYMTLQELGIAKYPGEKKVKEVTQALWGRKFRWTFASIFGVPAKVDTRPMQIFDDYYGILVNKYITKGANEEEAKVLAEEEFLKNLGDEFPLDRITFKGRESKAYVQPTSEAYNRVFVDNKKLAVSLQQLDPDVLGLLTLDIDYDKDDFNLSVYRKLQDPNTKLPGGGLFNDVKKTPKEIEELRMANRAWSAYNDLRDKLEAIALQDGDTWRSRQDLQAVLKKAGNTEIRKISEKWWKDWNDPNRGDKSFRYARGLYEIVSDENFMSKYGNTKLWDDVKEFILFRTAATTLRDSLPAYDERKSRIRDNYNAYIEQAAPKWHPKLRELIRRHFEEDTLKAVQ